MRLRRLDLRLRPLLLFLLDQPVVDREVDGPCGARVSTPYKYVRVLRFLAGGGSLDRFEAARNPAVADSSLNSTIAEIGELGIEVSRERIELPGRYGMVRCKRYWLSPEERQAAFRLLGEQG